MTAPQFVLMKDVTVLIYPTSGAASKIFLVLFNQNDLDLQKPVLLITLKIVRFSNLTELG